MDWLRELLEFIFSFFGKLPIIRAFLGFALVFFLPGFAWTLVFFRRISLIERVVLSFGLSIALVTFSLFSLNKLFGVGITSFNSVLVIIALTIIPLAIYYLNRLARRR